MHICFVYVLCAAQGARQASNLFSYFMGKGSSAAMKGSGGSAGTALMQPDNKVTQADGKTSCCQLRWLLQLSLRPVTTLKEPIALDAVSWLCVITLQVLQ